MKKLFFIVSIFFLSITSSFAVFFMDIQGDYMSTGDYKPVSGFAGGFGFSLTDDLSFLVRGSLAENTEHIGLPEEISYEYISITGGIEFIPQIAILDQYKIYWKNAINVGGSEFNVKWGMNRDAQAGPGLIASFQTGLQYNFTQTLSPYFDLGYHYSVYESTDPSIRGWQIAAGIRFYIYGSRDYDAGY